MLRALNDRCKTPNDNEPSSTKTGHAVWNKAAAVFETSDMKPADKAEKKEATHRSKFPVLLSAVPGPFIVLGVACLWGTNPIALRYLYRADGPPSPAVIAAIQSSAAAVVLTAAAVVSAWRTKMTASSVYQGHSSRPGISDSTDRTSLECEPAERSAADCALATWSDEVIIEPSFEENRITDDSRAAAYSGNAGKDAYTGLSLHTMLNFRTPRLWLAGAEVGAWAFLANALTVIGFQYTAAGRGAFLIRLSAIFTPLVAVVAGEKVVPLVWGGCVAALGGGILLGASNGNESGDVLLGVAPGDLALLGAAIMWSVQTVRLGKYTRSFPPLALAAAQMTSMAVLSDIWLATDILDAVQSGAPAISIWEDCRQPLSWLVMLWPAVGPWGLGTALQIVGQSSISASQTQVLLASDPLWAALFARPLGGGEGDLGPLGWPGGGLIVAGAVVAGIAGSRDDAGSREEAIGNAGPLPKDPRRG